MDMNFLDKVKNLTDRELLLFNIGETRSVRKLLTNHLHTHDVADVRRWKIYLMLFTVFVTTVVGVVVAFLVP